MPADDSARTGVCEECGFRWDIAPADLVAQLRRAPERYRPGFTRFLAGEDGAAILRTRPEPTVWSALEYAAHVRDAIGFYVDRVERVLNEDGPRLTAFGFDAACEERRYNEEDPAQTLDALAAQAGRCTGLLEPLGDDPDAPAWNRVGLSSDTGGTERTVLVLGRRAAHEVHHHLLDIGRVLRRVRASQPSA